MHVLLFVLIPVFLGTLVAIAGIALLFGVQVTDWMLHRFLLAHGHMMLEMLLTCVFMLSAWFVVYRFAPEATGSGIQEIKRVFMQKTPDRWWRVIPIKFFAGIAAISSQLLLGREGPTVQVGGNIGMMFADVLKLSKDNRILLIAAGSAAGLAAAFHAPIAGILFIFEEMKPYFTLSWKHVVIVSFTVFVSSFICALVIGNHPMISGAVFEFSSWSSMGWFCLFGVFMGLVGWGFNLFFIHVLDRLEQFQQVQHVIFLLLLGLLVGWLAIYSPYLVGEGYTLIDLGLRVDLPIQFVLLLLLGRLLLGCFSYGIRVPGGFFSPLLALGLLAGLFWCHLLRFFLILSPTDIKTYAVVGMAALFAAVVRSPLTAVILLTEMTHNMTLFIPMLVSCLIASRFMTWVKNPPIYDQLLARSRHLIKTP